MTSESSGHSSATPKEDRYSVILMRFACIIVGGRREMQARSREWTQYDPLHRREARGERKREDY